MSVKKLRQGWFLAMATKNWAMESTAHKDIVKYKHGSIVRFRPSIRLSRNWVNGIINGNGLIEPNADTEESWYIEVQTDVPVKKKGRTIFHVHPWNFECIQLQ